jgi:hypothetical protein
MQKSRDTVPLSILLEGWGGGWAHPVWSPSSIEPLQTLPHLGLGTEFRSEKIPRNRLGTIFVIPRKKVLIPRHSEFRGIANSEP